MPAEPLRPFAPPAQLLENLPAGVPSMSTALVWFLYTVFAFWFLYTLVISYHWLKYSHDSRLAIPSIVVHLFVSAALMSYALTGVFPHWL